MLSKLYADIKDLAEEFELSFTHESDYPYKECVKLMRSNCAPFQDRFTYPILIAGNFNFNDLFRYNLAIK